MKKRKRRARSMLISRMKSKIENGETQGTEYTEETMANGRTEVDAGSDFNGDIEA